VHHFPLLNLESLSISRSCSVSSAPSPSTQTNGLSLHSVVPFPSAEAPITEEPPPPRSARPRSTSAEAGDGVKALAQDSQRTSAGGLLRLWIGSQNLSIVRASVAGPKASTQVSALSTRRVILQYFSGSSPPKRIYVSCSHYNPLMDTTARGLAHTRSPS
jgi:hypothetical protein